MPTIHLHEMTTATPEQIVAALTDFGPGRSKIFENSADDELKVHDQGPNHADVTEGGRGTWERLPPLRLVRSQPHRHGPPSTPTSGEATRATPTPSRRSLTGGPPWTP